MMGKSLLQCVVFFLFAGDHAAAFVAPHRIARVSSKLLSSVATDRDIKVQQVLSLAREIGPVGILASKEDQERLALMSKELLPYSDQNPSAFPLRGFHDLVYSASEGGSSGRLFGSVHGKVQQEFLEDNETFINSVTLGPFQAMLRATRSTKNESTSLVKFHQTKIVVFGQTLLEKEIKGGGFWRYLFMGKIVDAEGKEKLIRVMETPSLFILEQPL